ncbi:MAG: hypothetical protein HZA94_02895 [Candidatus Vogelbacteria bacterium]|nr:hypothetical protein [Candidatus Vogelbacteria bacterium]
MDAKDGMIRVIFMDNLAFAMDVLGGVIERSGLDPRICHKVIVQQNDEDLVGHVLLAVINTVDVSLVSDGPAVALEIKNLTRADLAVIVPTQKLDLSPAVPIALSVHTNLRQF